MPPLLLRYSVSIHTGEKKHLIFAGNSLPSLFNFMSRKWKRDQSQVHLLISLPEPPTRQPHAPHITCRHLQNPRNSVILHMTIITDIGTSGTCRLWQLTVSSCSNGLVVSLIVFPLRRLNGIHATQSNLHKHFTCMSALMEVQPMAREQINRYISLLFLCSAALELLALPTL